jgi:hypothetical protein
MDTVSGAEFDSAHFALSAIMVSVESKTKQ